MYMYMYMYIYVSMHRMILYFSTQVLGTGVRICISIKFKKVNFSIKE